MDIRLGNGFDVHALIAGDHVKLCGVNIPHSAALKGHSDADVGLHAITDAIYGAVAEGDIGRHFPPSELKWKNANSDIFLKHAVELSAEKGFVISNIDCTLICEEPQIQPYAEKMISFIAKTTRVDKRRISVKATTSEKLGFTGRKQGIASMATACLIKS